MYNLLNKVKKTSERVWLSLMYENFLPDRLAELRMQKGISARDMSLSLGQANNYINTIENKKSLPSMQSFFYICEFMFFSGLLFNFVYDLHVFITWYSIY